MKQWNSLHPSWEVFKTRLDNAFSNSVWFLAEPILKRIGLEKVLCNLICPTWSQFRNNTFISTYIFTPVVFWCQKPVRVLVLCMVQFDVFRNVCCSWLVRVSDGFSLYKIPAVPVKDLGQPRACLSLLSNSPLLLRKTTCARALILVERDPLN